MRVCRECAELPAFFVAGGTLSGELLRFRKVERKADARGRGRGASCPGIVKGQLYRRSVSAQIPKRPEEGLE